MSFLAILGLVLIILALFHIIPILIGVIIGVVLVIVGGGFYYNGRRGGPP